MLRLDCRVSCVASIVVRIAVVLSWVDAAMVGFRRSWGVSRVDVGLGCGSGLASVMRMRWPT